MTKFSAGVGTGFVAEALTMLFMPKGARLIGGRNPGFDIALGELDDSDYLRVQVKSAAIGPRTLQEGAAPVETVGIRLNTTFDPGKSDWFVMPITSKIHQEIAAAGETEVSLGPEGLVVVATSTTFLPPKVYALETARVRDVFQKPLKRDGVSRHVSETNLWAPVSELIELDYASRVFPPTR